MFRHIKRAGAQEIEGRLNKVNSDLESMIAQKNIGRDELFILHDVLYQALEFIPKGAAVVPMRNCKVKPLNELNGGN